MEIDVIPNEEKQIPECYKNQDSEKLNELPETINRSIEEALKGIHVKAVLEGWIVSSLIISCHVTRRDVTRRGKLLGK